MKRQEGRAVLERTSNTGAKKFPDFTAVCDLSDVQFILGLPHIGQHLIT
jgi:hypothetical protein